MKPFLSSSFWRPAGFCQQPRRFSHTWWKPSGVTGGRWIQVNCPRFFKTDWFGESRLSGKKARSSFVAACRSESAVQLSSSGAVLFFLIHPPHKREDLDSGWIPAEWVQSKAGENGSLFWALSVTDIIEMLISLSRWGPSELCISSITSFQTHECFCALFKGCGFNFRYCKKH